MAHFAVDCEALICIALVRYVVVEGAVSAELTGELLSQVRSHLLKRHTIDLNNLHSTLTLSKLQRAFSPDGSGEPPRATLA